MSWPSDGPVHHCSTATSTTTPADASWPRRRCCWLDGRQRRGSSETLSAARATLHQQQLASLQMSDQMATEPHPASKPIATCGAAWNGPRRSFRGSSHGSPPCCSRCRGLIAGVLAAVGGVDGLGDPVVRAGDLIVRQAPENRAAI